jgi:hypothetical protein
MNEMVENTCTHRHIHNTLPRVYYNFSMAFHFLWLTHKMRRESDQLTMMDGYWSNKEIR